MKAKNTTALVRLALLTALELVMAYTPLGYLRTPGLEITFLMIPVVLGAVLMGPAAGAFLGGVFGLTSFGTCFGTSAFGAALLAINPVGTFITCVAARVLAGWLCGLCYRALSRSHRPGGAVLWLATLIGPLLNTVFFMTGLVLFFYRTDYIQSFVSAMGAANPFVFAVMFVGLQGLLEAAVCCVVSALVAKALLAYLKRGKA